MEGGELKNASFFQIFPPLSPGVGDGGEAGLPKINRIFSLIEGQTLKHYTRHMRCTNGRGNN